MLTCGQPESLRLKNGIIKDERGEREEGTHAQERETDRQTDRQKEKKAQI